MAIKDCVWLLVLVPMRMIEGEEVDDVEEVEPAEVVMVMGRGSQEKLGFRAETWEGRLGFLGAYSSDTIIDFCICGRISMSRIH